jgi:hypothetical protein
VDLPYKVVEADEIWSYCYAKNKNVPTNGFSRKVENLAHTVSLHFMHYNFARPHSALKERYPRTPAMAAG